MPVEAWRRVPERFHKNILFRRHVLRECRNNPELQRAVFDLCKRDFLFWCAAFVWQYNPNAVGEFSRELGPFILFEKQREAATEIIWCIENGESLLLEKSREMGASWLCLLVMVWYFLFHDWKKFLIVSRSEEAVDRAGEADSLFWKIEFVLARLPDWMAGPGITKSKRVFTNPRTNSSITGQATTKKAGVGGRATAMFVDEVSQIEFAKDIFDRTEHTTSCRIFNGTHLSVGTFFYKMACGEIPIKKLVLHWSHHPDKNKGLYSYDPDRPSQPLILDKSYRYPPDYQFVLDGKPTGGPFAGIRSPWYDKKTYRKDPRAVAMDLDIDPQGSASQPFDPVLINSIRRKYAVKPDTYTVNMDELEWKVKELVLDAAGKLKLWVRPEPTGHMPVGRYSAGSDIALGTGASPSCLSVFNARIGEKVAEYVDARINPTDFARLAVALCKLFRDENGRPAFFVWEQTGGAGGVFGPLVVRNYTHYYLREDPILDRVGQRATKPGWYPTAASKNMLIADYKQALYDGRFVNRSDEALRQTLEFIYEEGTGNIIHPKEKAALDPSGARLSHGDVTVADALAWLGGKDLGWRGEEPEAPEHVYPNSMLGRRRAWEARQLELDEQWD